MKTLIVLLALSLAPAAFASASWKVTCVSESGINFYNENGFAEIQFNDTLADGTVNKTTMEVNVENYDLGFEDKEASVKWLGKQDIISDSYENSCNSDHILTVFSQKVEITRKDTKTSQIVDVVCRDETITSSAGDGEECSAEEI